MLSKATSSQLFWPAVALAITMIALLAADEFLPKGTVQAILGGA